MAFTNGQKIATWFGTDLIVYIQGGKSYLFQRGSQGELVPRGGGLLYDTVNTVKVSGLIQADIDAVEKSDAYGTQPPAGVTAPTGYSAKLLESGATVFVLTEDVTTYVDLTATEESEISRSAKLTENPIEWAKENPLQAAGLAFVLYMIAVQVLVKNKAKKKKYSFGLLA